MLRVWSSHRKHGQMPTGPVVPLGPTVPETTHNTLGAVKRKSDHARPAYCEMCLGWTHVLEEVLHVKAGLLQLVNQEQLFPTGVLLGISARANPDCFVIMLSSNPISISGHSINRIKTELKVIIQLECPQGARTGCSDSETCCLQEAPRLSPL